MKSTTATSLRKELFGALERALRSQPTRIRYKKGDAILLSYRQYQAWQRRRPLPKRASRGRRTLAPLIEGKIRKPLDSHAEAELMRYMGLACPTS